MRVILPTNQLSGHAGAVHTPHPRSPTTAWSTPSDSPDTAAPAARTPSKPSSDDSTSSRRTPGHHGPPPAGKSRGLNRPGMSGELIRWKDHSHGTSLEVPDRAA